MVTMRVMVRVIVKASLATNTRKSIELFAAATSACTLRMSEYNRPGTIRISQRNHPVKRFCSITIVGFRSRPIHVNAKITSRPAKSTSRNRKICRPSSITTNQPNRANGETADGHIATGYSFAGCTVAKIGAIA